MIPKEPFMFIKPYRTVQDQGRHCHHPQGRAEDAADYEGELCIVLSRDAKGVFKANALSYVAPYTYANDFSARKLQHEAELAGHMPQ
ncbi:fumarylacetoacetate hydrolase family protein [Microdochium nivale]|nr:fumarylacetoacetate hydrolase family protein [Microdochium nivale]